jgi:hypothetical protein
LLDVSALATDAIANGRFVQNSGLAYHAAKVGKPPSTSVALQPRRIFFG